MSMTFMFYLKNNLSSLYLIFYTLSFNPYLSILPNNNIAFCVLFYHGNHASLFPNNSRNFTRSYLYNLSTFNFPQSLSLQGEIYILRSHNLDYLSNNHFIKIIVVA